MTDKEHARAIVDAATHLNSVIEKATQDGLNVELDLLTIQQVGQRIGSVQVTYRVTRVTEIG